MAKFANRLSSGHGVGMGDGGKKSNETKMRQQIRQYVANWGKTTVWEKSEKYILTRLILRCLLVIK